MVGIPAASANAVFHATDRPSGSCRLRRTSCCKAVKGANNLNKEPSAAQKMLSVKARVGALYSGSFHASQFPRRTLLGFSVNKRAATLRQSGCERRNTGFREEGHQLLRVDQGCLYPAVERPSTPSIPFLRWSLNPAAYPCFIA